MNVVRLAICVNVELSYSDNSLEEEKRELLVVALKQNYATESHHHRRLCVLFPFLFFPSLIFFVIDFGFELSTRLLFLSLSSFAVASFLLCYRFIPLSIA